MLSLFCLGLRLSMAAPAKAELKKLFAKGTNISTVIDGSQYSTNKNDKK